ncbi:MAG: hypothetical protein PHI73_03015 [Patescibacteria group bacterium]|nr:hypothetical protein [Patescibacteria group bacterium]
MHYTLTFFWIILAFASISFWEAYIEGEHGGAEKQVGWVRKIFGLRLTGYHFMLFGVCLPLFLLLPIITHGYDGKLLAVIACGYLVGILVEDFLWFVVNPKFKFKDFRHEKVWWYPWMRVGSYHIPVLYPGAIVLSGAIWYLFIR